MNAVTRRWVTLLALAIACVLPLGSAQAANDTENVATAITEQDDSQVFDFAWDVSRQRGDDPVEHLNKAIARARCTRCGATAIAFQIVLVSGSPTTVMPRNVADAINVECTECQVVAEARQFVRVVPQPVRFNGEGRAILADVRNELRSLESRNLPIDQLHQAVETQEARVREVLRDDLVLKSDPDTDAEFLKQRTLQAADLD
jgi:putative peptide zinc metalloprotease protein